MIDQSGETRKNQSRDVENVLTPTVEARTVSDESLARPTPTVSSRQEAYPTTAQRSAASRIKTIVPQVISLARELSSDSDDESLADRIAELGDVTETSGYSADLLARTQIVLNSFRQTLSRSIECCDVLCQGIAARQRLTKSDVAHRMREINESIRRLSDDGFAAIESELTERFRSRTLPTSLVMNRIQNRCEDLSIGDLSTEQFGRNVRLQLNPEARRQAEQSLRRSLSNAVEEDVAWLNERLDAVVKQACERLQAAPTTAPAGNAIAESLSPDDVPVEKPASPSTTCRYPEHDALSAEHILAWLQPQLALTLKYSGEIPHRTVLDRLSHGRRPVFALMMVLSLAGAAFGYGRGMTTLLAPLLLILFVGGIAWTFHSFREERQWLLERELTRLRDVMGNECRRHFEDLLKEWSSRAVRWLRDQHKSQQHQVDDFLRQTLVESETALEALQDEVRRAEQRQRELAQLDQRLTRLCEACMS